MKTRILVVDDESEIRMLMQMHLKRKGFEVDIAAGCGEARERVDSSHYDLVISDFRMPDGTGVDVFKGLKSDTRFILISGFSDLDEQQLRSIGIKEILSKPVKFDTLLDVVRTSLSP